MNAISFFIPPNAKVVSIEDTREIDLPHNNWIQSVTRGSASHEGRGEVTMYRLLQAALRQRPEYILVGEIRTEERVALTFFQAMGTGHTAYTTLHADSVETAINRLQNPPLQVPRAMIQDLDIVSIQTQTFMGDDRVRRNRQVAEILTPPEDDPTAIPTRNVFERDAVRDVHERVGESTVLAEIAEERGWTDEELAAELGNREAVLRFLVEEGVTDYRDVASVLQLYAKDPDYVMKHVRTHGYDAETGAPIGQVN
jgi:flagellar protein FlaI